MRLAIGICVQELEIIAKAGEPDETVNGVHFLPL